MKYILIISMYLFVAFPPPAQAAVKGETCTPSKVESFNADRIGEAGVLSCVYRRCAYIPVYANAKSTRKKLNEAITGARANLCGIRECNVGGEGREVTFWAECQEKLDELKTMVKDYDVTRKRSGKREIILQVKILHLSNGAINNLSLGMTGILDGIVNDVPPRAEASSSGLSFALGNLTNHMLNINFSGSRDTTSTSVVEEEEIRGIYQGDEFSTESITNVYRDSEASLGGVNTEQAGYVLEAEEVQIDESQGVPQIVLHGAEFFYAEPIEGERTITRHLKRHYEEIVIPYGRPYIMTAASLSVEQLNDTKGIPYLKYSKVKSASKLLAFVSGWPVDSPPAEDEQLLPLTTEQLREVELREKPETDFLKSAEFSVLPVGDSTGFDLVRFQMSELSGLAQSNYREMIRVTVNGAGLKNRSELVFAEHLINGYFQIPSSFHMANSDSEVEMEVKLDWADLKRVPRGHKKSVKYKILHRQKQKYIRVVSKK